MTDQSKMPTEYDYRLAVLHKMVEMKPVLDPAFEHSLEKHTFKDAFDLVACGKCLFFWKGNSCAVLEWRVFPVGKTIHCLWAGGKYAELLELYDGVAAFAKTNGAVAMTTLGRDGFRKRLPKAGWKIAGTWFVKEFAKGESQ